jgi:DNA polymerase-2
METLEGWLLDLYEDAEHGLTIWLIDTEERRWRLYQHFPVRFFAAGPSARLRSLWRWLSVQPEAPLLGREERRDLFLPAPIPVLAVEVRMPSELRALFERVNRAFPDLTYYDADLQVQIRHAAAYGTFPLAHCQVSFDACNNIQELHVLDSPWDTDPEPPPLRIMEISVDTDPRHTHPGKLILRYRTWEQEYPFLEGSTPSFWVKAALQKYDPDLLITDYGDTWLFEELLARVGGDLQKLPLSRDLARGFTAIKEKTYFSYGQVIYRGMQMHLHGRVHIDRKNAMMWGDYGLEGILENARVTALPIQTAARVSPGTGISSMQMITALKTNVLVPWRKQQAERPKSMLDLIHSDSGGLVYQPTPGLHRDVGEIDFVSMYPAVMVRCNISPEKKPITLSDPPDANPGLVPQTLAPLLKKRVTLKNRAAGLPAWDPRRSMYKARASAHKWLLVVCFGYLGYRNARFGRIEAHEAVTAGGREALLRAKEAAEDTGYQILHMFVDCLWIQKQQARKIEDFQPLIEEIQDRTGLQIAIDGIYRWVVFLPSRVDQRVPVGNRYFGVFQDGTIKVRGLEARRRDTPPWVAQTQMRLIEYLAQAPDADQLPAYLPGAIEILRQALQQLRAGQVPLEELLVSQKLSRELSKYTTPSATARAALQLKAVGKAVEPGQRVRFLFVRGWPNIWAWDHPDRLDSRRIDIAVYQKLLLRAAESIFQPFGASADDLKLWLEGNAAAVPLLPTHVPPGAWVSSVRRISAGEEAHSGSLKRSPEGLSTLAAQAPERPEKQPTPVLFLKSAPNWAGSPPAHGDLECGRKRPGSTNRPASPAQPAAAGPGEPAGWRRLPLRPSAVQAWSAEKPVVPLQPSVPDNLRAAAPGWNDGSESSAGWQPPDPGEGTCWPAPGSKPGEAPHRSGASARRQSPTRSHNKPKESPVWSLKDSTTDTNVLAV